MAKGYQRRLEQNEPTAWFGLSNVFASLAAAGVAAFGGLAITAWQQLRARSARFDAEAAPRWPFALACAGLVVSLAGVAMSQSKGGAGSAVVGLAVLGVLWWLTIQSRRSLRAGASLLGPALVCAAMGAVVVRGMVGLRIGELSLLFRWFYMQAAWRITGEHLPWGVGPDGFKEAYLLAKNPLNPEEVQSPHCLTWDWLACLGWGGACWLGAFVVLLVLAGRAVCRPEFAEPRAGESSDEPFSMTDSRPWIRCVLVVPVVATFGSLLLETAAMTPENALLRIGCLVVWCALSATALVVLLPSVRAIAWRVGLAGSAIALAVHTQIEVTGVSVQACGLLMSFVAIAAAPAGNAEPARAEGPRRVPGAWLLCLPLAAGAVLLATSSARLFAWEDGLRRAATHLAPIAEAAAEFAAARSETDSARRSGHLRAAAAILEPIRKVSTPDNPAEIGQALDAALDVVLPRGIESLTAAASAGPFDWATVRERSRLQLRLGASMASRGDKAGAAAQFERALACGREAAARAPGALASWRVTVLLSWRGMVPSPAIADRLLTELDAAQAFDPYSTTLALHRFRVLKAEGRPPSEVAAAARHLLELDDYQRLDRDVRGLSDKDRSEAQAAVGK